MDFGEHEIGCFDLVCFTNQLVLLLRTKQEQPRALEWSVMHLDFSQFGKNLNLHMASGFMICEISTPKFTSIWALVCWITCYKSKEIILGWIGTLVNQFVNSDWLWSGLCIMTISNFWTKAKWNWLVHFAWNLFQIFLSISLSNEKGIRLKGVVVWKWHAIYIEPAWPKQKMGSLLNELGLGHWN